MSAIFGIINFDKKRLDASKLHTMQASIGAWQPDRSHRVTNENAGFGKLLRYNTPEAVFERLPCTTAAGNLFTAEARIDNRDALCRQLEISSLEASTLPDTGLILRAYEKWGEACVDHLLGDWSFAIWNPATQHLFLARDHHGNTALYYHAGKRFFAFASSIHALNALGVPTQLNESYLGHLLVASPAFQTDTTVNRHIKRLLPAHTLVLTKQNVQTRRYWDVPVDRTPRYRSFEDYAEAFLELYREVVRCRLRTFRPISTTLSSGLDSSSVTVLAAEQRQQQSKPLIAFTATPRYNVDRYTSETLIADESHRAKLTARLYPNIVHHCIRAENVTPLSGVAQLVELQQFPPYAGSNSYWIMALMQAAQQAGTGTLLTGQGGNGTVSWGGVPSIREYRYWKGKRLTLKHSVPSFVYRFWRQVRPLGNRWPLSAIHPRFAAQLALAASVDADRMRVKPWDLETMQRQIIGLGQSMVGENFAALEIAYGIEIRDPTLDKRMIEFALSAPNWVFRDSQQTRRLIRHAMRDKLPEQIRLNRAFGRQSADISERVLHSKSEINTTLNRLAQSSATNYLDLPKMGALLHGPNLLDRTGEVMAVLMRGLGVGLYLSKNGIA